MFLVIRDGGDKQEFNTKTEAIAWGRERESFAIYDEDDNQVYCEYPIPEWQ